MASLALSAVCFRVTEALAARPRKCRPPLKTTKEISHACLPCPGVAGGLLQLDGREEVWTTEDEVIEAESVEPTDGRNAV